MAAGGWGNHESVARQGEAQGQSQRLDARHPATACNQLHAQDQCAGGMAPARRYA